MEARSVNTLNNRTGKFIYTLVKLFSITSFPFHCSHEDHHLKYLSTNTTHDFSTETFKEIKLSSKLGYIYYQSSFIHSFIVNSINPAMAT
jgi:hypothetical protein